MTRALLLDLDDTLISDEPVAQATFLATAAHASGVDAAELAAAARRHSAALWRAGPLHAYCRAIQISSWEGLWCRFDGEDPRMAALREWAPGYRAGSWSLALAELGVRDEALAAELGERYGEERRARHATFEDVEPALDDLARDHVLALVTNGASCLQREKLAASGLGHRFAAVAVSGEIDVGKPDPAIFEHVLAAIGADAADEVMVGNSLAHDVAGARAAGIRPVWVNRFGQARPADEDDLAEVTTLAGLRAVL